MPCSKCCDSENQTIRDAEEQKKLINRLSRIEGQIRGLKGMIEDDRYCIDIINQASAVSSALNGFTKELLARHINTCVKSDIEAGNDEKINELIETLQKVMK